MRVQETLLQQEPAQSWECAYSPLPSMHSQDTLKNSFKHLFKRKLQTTPLFNLSKKDNDKLVILSEEA